MSYEQFQSYLKKMKGPRRNKHITMAIISAILYQIWQVRNTTIFKTQLVLVPAALKQIKENIIYRILYFNSRTQKYNAYIDGITR